MSAISLILPLLIGAMPLEERSSVPTPPKESAAGSGRTKAPQGGDRKPTEEEIRRGHEMLAGEWEIESIVDDGSDVGPKLIRAKFAEDGRLRIGTRIASFVTPSTEEKHVSSIRINPAKRPSQIDLTTQLDTVLKGIYKFDGDRLILCLAKHEEDDRPTDFEAPAGSDRALFRLAMARPVPKPVVTASVVSTPEPKPAPTPSPEEKARRRDEQIREMLAGSWTFNDRKGAVTLVLRSDGTFVSTRSWAKAFKRLIEGETATSEGLWVYSHGTLTGRISKTTDPFLLGHGYSARLQSIGEDTLVFKDVVGELQTARKLR